MITGLTRRDVNRIYLEKRQTVTQPHLASRVLSVWEQNPKFRTKGGKPRALTFGTDNCEFKELIDVVSKDVNHAAVLFELERLGAVVRSGNLIKLTKGIQYCNEDIARAYGVLAGDIDYLTQIAEENVRDKHANIRNLHLRTEYDNIFTDDLPRIKEWFFKEGMRFHKKARDFLSKFDKDINPHPHKTGGGKIAVGTFSWTAIPEE